MIERKISAKRTKKQEKGEKNEKKGGKVRGKFEKNDVLRLEIIPNDELTFVNFFIAFDVLLIWNF